MFIKNSSGIQGQQQDESFYRGIVVKNDDPLKLNRVKVYVPELSNQPFEEWFEKLDDIKVKTPGRDSWSDTSLFNEMIENIPWAEPCYPLMGESGGSRAYNNGSGTDSTISDGNYAEGFEDGQYPTEFNTVGDVVEFSPPIKLSNYGYADDSTPDSYSANGIGHKNNRLIDGKSAAVTKSLANRLGLQHNDWFRVKTSRGVFELQYGDTVPSYDKRTGPLPETIDIYRRTGGSNSWGGKIFSFEKLETSENIDNQFDNIDTGDDEPPSLLPPLNDSNEPDPIQPVDTVSGAPARLYENRATMVNDPFSNPLESSSMKCNSYSFGYAPQNMTNQPKGAVGIPEVGSKVWIFHYLGDLNFPVYFGVTQDFKGLATVNKTDNLMGMSPYYPNDFENT